MSAAGSGTMQEGQAQATATGESPPRAGPLPADEDPIQGEGWAQGLGGQGDLAVRRGGGEQKDRPLRARGVLTRRHRATAQRGTILAMMPPRATQEARPRGGTSCGCFLWVGCLPPQGKCPGAASARKSWAQGWRLLCECPSAPLFSASCVFFDAPSNRPGTLLMLCCRVRGIQRPPMSHLTS